MNARSLLNAILDHLIEAQMVIAGLSCLFLIVTHSFVWLYACGALMLMTIALRYEYHIRRLVRGGAGVKPLRLAAKAWLSAALLIASFALVPASILLSRPHAGEPVHPKALSAGSPTSVP